MATLKQFLPPPPPTNTQSDTPEITGGPVNVYGESLSEFDWRAKFRTDMVTQAEKWADQLGVDKFALDSFVRDQIDGALGFITQSVFMPNRGSTITNLGDGVLGQSPDGAWQPESTQDWQQIWDAGVLYFSGKLGVDLQNIGGRRGGGGSSGPSAADIRNSFDEDELTDAVQSLWGAHLFEDTTQARAIAKNYINAVVAGKGQKEIDFKTFVTNRMKQTPRWKMIYRNKPEGQDPLEYSSKYAQMAESAVGGGQGNKKLVGSLAAGGAALGASQDAFAGRLQRTDAQRNSQGFINGLEETVRGVSQVLRG